MIYDIVQKIGQEKQPKESKKSKITFNCTLFKKIFGMWIFGGILAFIPRVLVFILGPVRQLTAMEFFNDFEIIYICVTMAIIAMSEALRRKIDMFFLVNIIVVIFGMAIYGLLIGGARIPILRYGNGLSIFNMIFFGVIMILGIIGFITICVGKKVEN